MSGDRGSRGHDDYSDRRLPPIRERFGDLLDQPVESRHRENRHPVSSSEYYARPSSHTVPRGGYMPSHQQQQPQPHSSHHVQRHSDRHPQQHSREPRDERRTDTREPHSFHVHSIRQGAGMVHQSTTVDDSFRLRPRKADPADPTRRYSCDECDERFDRPSALQTHKLTHSGEKPFQCGYPGCGKRFTSMSNKTRHEKTHSATSAFEDADQGGHSSRQQRGSSSYYHYGR